MAIIMALHPCHSSMPSDSLHVLDGRLLMGKAAGLIEHGHEDGREMDARDILDRAHAATKDQVGSSTACIGIMLPEGKLQVRSPSTGIGPGPVLQAS